MAYADSVLIFFAGSCAGSFLNVCIYRLPRGIGLLAPRRSFCPACRVSIRWPDNIPLFSYLCLGGRCRDCRSAISPVYPLIEIVSGALALLCLARGVGGAAFIYLLFFYALLVISAIDLAHRIIPNRILLLLLLLGVAGTLQLEMPPGGIALPGLLGGALLLLLVRWLGGIIFRSAGDGGCQTGGGGRVFPGLAIIPAGIVSGGIAGVVECRIPDLPAVTGNAGHYPFRPIPEQRMPAGLVWRISFQFSVVSDQFSAVSFRVDCTLKCAFTIHH